MPAALLLSYNTNTCQCPPFNSQGYNLYKLKKISLEPVKIADYFIENNVFTLCLKIVSSRLKNITSSR